MPNSKEYIKIGGHGGARKNAGRRMGYKKSNQANRLNAMTRREKKKIDIYVTNKFMDIWKQIPIGSRNKYIITAVIERYNNSKGIADKNRSDKNPD